MAVGNDITRIFADDAKIGREVKNKFEAQNLQANLNVASDWTHDWSLKLNIDKCKVLHLGKNNLLFTYNIQTLEGQIELDSVDSERDMAY